MPLFVSESVLRGSTRVTGRGVVRLVSQARRPRYKEPCRIWDVFKQLPHVVLLILETPALTALLYSAEV